MKINGLMNIITLSLAIAATTATHAHAMLGSILFVLRDDGEQHPESDEQNDAEDANEFLRMIKDGNISATLRWLRSDINFLHASSPDGQTALHFAAYGHYFITCRLLNLILATDRCAVDAQDCDGRTALYVAVAHSPEHVIVALVRALLNAGADATIAIAAGETPLQAAIRRNNQPVVALLQQALAHRQPLGWSLCGFDDATGAACGASGEDGWEIIDPPAV